jgi:predicted PurR-regulated permease PerM
MPESSDEPVKKSRLSAVALGFALAALLSAWNPLSAPIGFAVALAAAVLAGRALQKNRPRRVVACAALGVSLGSAVLAALVLVLAAGSLSAGLKAGDVVLARPVGQVDALLDEAAKRTAAERARAEKELPAAQKAADGGPRDK